MRRLIFIFALSLLAACSQQARFNSTDITGADFGSDFALTDHHGKSRHMEDFRGKVVVMFFGYTQCPDVCPTNLSALAAVMKQLGTDADRVQVLFVTLDPERDTASLLASYVPAFHPTFLGLLGTAAETAATAKSFKVFYQKQPGSNPKSYTIDHSTGSYVFDPKGRLRLYVTHNQKVEITTEDIKRLLSGS